MTSIGLRPRPEIRGREAQSASGAAGPLAVREGDVFLQFRASWLVKGFENAAPAWLAKRSPATNLIRVYP